MIVCETMRIFNAMSVRTRMGPIVSAKSLAAKSGFTSKKSER
jgi:hypothetical protein